ncbi:PadR family transcriptional regulator [Candidatus Woesearchaeota archaeon]|nr:PadR family transcriptional regulator [Candidatus Woesearchaeota archaeon]
MKGFLSFIVLGLIGKKPMSGEDIRVELKARKGTKPSPGTVYPVLKALAKTGLIEEAAGVSDGRKIKNYIITSKGRKELKDANRRFCQMFFDMKQEMDHYCGCHKKD